MWRGKLHRKREININRDEGMKKDTKEEAQSKLKRKQLRKRKETSHTIYSCIASPSSEWNTQINTGHAVVRKWIGTSWLLSPGRTQRRGSSLRFSFQCNTFNTVSRSLFTPHHRVERTCYVLTGKSLARQQSFVFVTCRQIRSGNDVQTEHISTSESDDLNDSKYSDTTHWNTLSLYENARLDSP